MVHGAAESCLESTCSADKDAVFKRGDEVERIWYREDQSEECLVLSQVMQQYQRPQVPSSVENTLSRTVSLKDLLETARHREAPDSSLAPRQGVFKGFDFYFYPSIRSGIRRLRMEKCEQNGGTVHASFGAHVDFVVMDVGMYLERFLMAHNLAEPPSGVRLVNQDWVPASLVQGRMANASLAKFRVPMSVKTKEQQQSCQYDIKPALRDIGDCDLTSSGSSASSWLCGH